MSNPEHEFKRFIFSEIRVEINPGEFITYAEGVEQHPGQIQIHFGNWRYYVADWARRVGKTISASAEVLITLAQPNKRIWIVAPNYELTDRVFDYVWKWVVQDRIFEKLGFGENCIVAKSKSANRRYIETAWGSFVQGKSADSPDSLVGEQLDLIVFDECARCMEFIWTDNLEACTP